MYFFFLILEVKISLFIAEKRCWIFLLHRYNTAAWQAYSESQPVPPFVRRNVRLELRDWGSYERVTSNLSPGKLHCRN